MSDLGNKEIFGQNLDRLIKQRGTNVSGLASALHYSVSTVWDWVKGNSYPRIDRIEALANYFGVKKSALVERQTDTPAAPAHTYPYIPGGLFFYRHFAQKKSRPEGLLNSAIAR